MVQTDSSQSTASSSNVSETSTARTSPIRRSSSEQSGMYHKSPLAHTVIPKPRKQPRTNSPPRQFKEDRGRLHAKASSGTLLKRLINEEYETKQTKKRLNAALSQVESVAARTAAMESSRLGRDLQELEQTNNMSQLVENAQERANQIEVELNMYKMQLRDAQDQSTQVQQALREAQAQREDAEAAAKKAQKLARRLKEENAVILAREQGRRDGFNEGLEQGRVIALARQKALMLTYPDTSVVDGGGFIEDEDEGSKSGGKSAPQRSIPKEPRRSDRPSRRAPEGTNAVSRSNTGTSTSRHRLRTRSQSPPSNARNSPQPVPNFPAYQPPPSQPSVASPVLISREQSGSRTARRPADTPAQPFMVQTASPITRGPPTSNPSPGAPLRNTTNDKPTMVLKMPPPPRPSNSGPSSVPPSPAIRIPFPLDMSTRHPQTLDAPRSPASSTTTMTGMSHLQSFPSAPASRSGSNRVPNSAIGFSGLSAIPEDTGSARTPTPTWQPPTQPQRQPASFVSRQTVEDWRNSTALEAPLPVNAPHSPMSVGVAPATQFAVPSSNLLHPNSASNLTRKASTGSNGYEFAVESPSEPSSASLQSPSGQHYDYLSPNVRRAPMPVIPPSTASSSSSSSTSGPTSADYAVYQATGFPAGFVPQTMMAPNMGQAMGGPPAGGVPMYNANATGAAQAAGLSSTFPSFQVSGAGRPNGAAPRSILKPTGPWQGYPGAGPSPSANMGYPLPGVMGQTRSAGEMSSPGSMHSNALSPHQRTVAMNGGRNPVYQTTMADPRVFPPSPLAFGQPVSDNSSVRSYGDYAHQPFIPPGGPVIPDSGSSSSEDSPSMMLDPMTLANTQANSGYTTLTGTPMMAPMPYNH